MNKYKKITEARKLLGLPEKATIKEVKSAYRNLVKKWHPDTCKENNDKCKEMTQKIITAYETIISYCNEYKISFAEKEVKKFLSGEDWWFERFGSDPLWGNPKRRE